MNGSVWPGFNGTGGARTIVQPAIGAQRRADLKSAIADLEVRRAELRTATARLTEANDALEASLSRRGVR